MADTEVGVDQHVVGELIREDPVDAPVEVVHTEHDEAAEPESGGSIVIRHVLERQLGAGHSLGAQLVGVTTDVSVGLAHTPVTVVDEIRGGATLPEALGHSGREVRGVVATAGVRFRTAVGEYVGTQAALPNAVVVGAADVAEAVLRAQGTVTGSAIDAVFTVATVAARGGDVQAALSQERSEVSSRTNEVRAGIVESWRRAQEEIRGAVKDYDVAVEALEDDD
ncbi:MAG: hypothetical protein ABW001_04965 [Mycobacterium sp.]